MELDLVSWYKKMAYLYVGRRFEGQIQAGRFENLQRALRRAAIDATLSTYIGMTILTAILLGAAMIGAGVVSIFLLPVLGDLGILSVILCFILSPVVAVGVVFYSFNYLPRQREGGRRKNLEKSLSVASSYMLAMATAGVTPDKIFSSLRNPELPEPIIEEATKIDRDLEAFGYDILQTLEAASNRSPSEKWKKFLQGIIATINAGGDFVHYLNIENKAFMKDQEDSTKEFIEQLGVAAEIFMVLGVVAPLFFIIMIAILGTIGGGRPDTANMLRMGLLGLVYAIVPILMGFMIYLVDTLE
ncbi:MAG: type II secretion system F family protein [Candidatus Hodarchaeota archaeon]